MARTQNYGGRNGVSALIRLIKAICRLYTAYSARIIAYIQSSALSSDQKTTVLAWLNGAAAACAILQLVEVRYE